MEAKLLHSLITKPPLQTSTTTTTTTTLCLPSPSAGTRHAIVFLSLRRPHPPKLMIPIRSSGNANAKATEPESSEPASPPVPQVTPPPETVEVRFRRRSSRRRERQGGGESRRAEAAPVVKSSKKWEEMSAGEKAIELYVGEKGALYWLNKFAYASIFIVIGGWILFRFLGPALNLYQLDTPPLAPDAIFKGT